jgi:hypothetical protein
VMVWGFCRWFDVDCCLRFGDAERCFWRVEGFGGAVAFLLVFWRLLLVWVVV